MVLFLLFAAALLGGTEEVDTIDLYVFGASYHPGHADDFEQLNPGLGIGLSRVRVGASWSPGIECLAAAYRDSFGELGVVVAAGPKIVVGSLDRLHGEISVPLGWLRGSAWDGFVILPHAGIGWGPWMLEGIYVPKQDDGENMHPHGHPGYPMTSALGAWVKYSIRW